MTNYIVLDLENPNSRGNSICSIAVVVVKNNVIVNKKYTLINPEDRFDIINSKINGIESSMVSNSPTLVEYWPEIKDLLTSNTIIGHNISYDLSVLTKALDRYDIEVPNFQFCCTLLLSQKYLSFNSYKLEEIAHDLKITYTPHNALEDAMATYQLFEYLNKKNEISQKDIRKYNYKNNNFDSSIEKIDERLSSNINDLFGIIKGINYDEVINQKELDLLKKWINDNLKYKGYAIFNKIINELISILEDNHISEYEKIELMDLAKSINSSNIYSETTLGMQILQGIMKGIISDEIIVIEEIRKLNEWLKRNDYLSGVYPYDKILLTVTDVLKDNIITAKEKEELARTFVEILNPVKKNETNIELNNKTFCLTGEFKNGSKADITQKLESLGATEKNGVSNKVDYLFVGGIGSDAWKYGNVGGKIAKAQELQEKGSSIKIISEDDLFKIVFNYVTT